jgi:cytochrome b subunit of formate dehydrogenase
MSSLRDAHHPIWRIGTILSVGVIVVAVNWWNAKQFDRDDWDRIMQILAGLGAGAGLKSFVTGKGSDG